VSLFDSAKAAKLLPLHLGTPASCRQLFSAYLCAFVVKFFKSRKAASATPGSADILPATLFSVSLCLCGEIFQKQQSCFRNTWERRHLTGNSLLCVLVPLW
jgi:hypothetical protein